jgi:hypothetical protein
MGRRDNYGIDLLPDQKAYQYAIDGLRERYTLVMVGKDKPIYPLQNIDLNLVNGTTVTDLIDLAAGSAGLVGYCSYMIPLAECLDKKGLFVWANKGLKSPDQYINTIRPEKILHKSTSYFFVDNKPADEAINAFLQQ